MTRVARAALAAALATAAAVGAAGCGSEHAGAHPPPATSASPSGSRSLQGLTLDSGGLNDLPNPGTGDADPRLAAALLTRFEDATRELPGAAVRLPVRDIRSMFVPVRQVSSYYDGPGEACRKWTSGLWSELITTYGHAPGAQLGVAMLAHDGRHLRNGTPAPVRSPVFSEAITTAPPDVLARLGDARVPAACGRLTAPASSPGEPTAAVRPVPVAPLGDGATAFRIVDARGTASHWVEIVRLRGHLIEIRVPNQAPEPPGDPMVTLQRIARAAYARAARALT